jgi:hypothetical protein
MAVKFGSSNESRQGLDFQERMTGGLDFSLFNGTIRGEQR